MPGACRQTVHAAGQDFKLPEKERDSSEVEAVPAGAVLSFVLLILEKVGVNELHDLNVLLGECSLILFNFFVIAMLVCASSSCGKRRVMGLGISIFFDEN